MLPRHPQSQALHFTSHHFVPFGTWFINVRAWPTWRAQSSLVLAGTFVSPGGQYLSAASRAADLLQGLCLLYPPFSPPLSPGVWLEAQNLSMTDTMVSVK